MIDYSLITLLVATALVVQLMVKARPAALAQVVLVGALLATFALRFAPAPGPLLAMLGQCLLAIGLLIHARASGWKD